MDHLKILGSPQGAGGEKLRDFILWSSELGIEFLTVFAFSTENWKREEREVQAPPRILADVNGRGEEAN